MGLINLCREMDWAELSIVNISLNIGLMDIESNRRDKCQMAISM